MHPCEHGTPFCLQFLLAIGTSAIELVQSIADTELKNNKFQTWMHPPEGHLKRIPFFAEGSHQYVQGIVLEQVGGAKRQNVNQWFETIDIKPIATMMPLLFRH